VLFIVRIPSEEEKVSECECERVSECEYHWVWVSECEWVVDCVKCEYVNECVSEFAVLFIVRIPSEEEKVSECECESETVRQWER